MATIQLIFLLMLAQDLFKLFLSVYIFLLYYSTMWFMGLEDPSLEQSGLISIIVGAGAAWFGLYAGTSNSSKNFKGED